MYIRCFCSILQVFQDQATCENDEFWRWRGASHSPTPCQLPATPCTFFATPCDSMHFFRLPATPSIFRRIFATPRYFLPIFWSKKLLGRWLTRPNALCLICFSTHTHKQQIHYIYHSKACDPRKKMCVAKRRSETCSLYFTRGFKVLRVTSCENFSFWFAQISMDRDNNSSSDTFQMIYIRILLSHTVR